MAQGGVAIELMVSTALTKVYSVSEGGAQGGVAIELMVSNALTQVYSVSEGVGHREVWL